ncbi:MAG: hypothetical protein HQM03_02375 [Magnetococcales bacterium]|nr:hypothetical protein [Magnetococcales bacterium]
MHSLKRIMLVAGRYQPSTPYRELLVKHRLERMGVEVRFVIPGRGLNKGAELDIGDHAEMLRKERAWRVDGEWEFRKAMRGCQMVVFSTWRSYLKLTLMARAEGRPTINFCAASGQDHWSHGVDRCLIRSAFTKRLLQHLHEEFGHPMPADSDIRVVGSIQYEYPEGQDPIGFPDRESFCRHYGLRPERPIAVFFPKGIQSFHKKVALWFPEWDQERVDRYNQAFLDKYAQICAQVRAAECNLLVKMHPTAYASYNCDSGFEFRYWEQYPWAKVLDAAHTMAMYRYADVGLGINSHSALDMGYFDKPFLYVDSDLLPPPNHPAFDTNKLGRLPVGPSSHWHVGTVTDNPWFRSWLGAFCRVEEIPGFLQNPRESLPYSREDWQAFIQEYWGMKDNNASERIANEILAFGEEFLGSWHRRLSVRHMRGAFWDGVERLKGGAPVGKYAGRRTQ